MNASDEGALLSGGGKVVKKESDAADGRAVRRYRSYSAQFKARVAFEALRGERSLVEIAGENGLPKETLSLWRHELKVRLPTIFDDYMLKHRKTRREVELEKRVKDLERRMAWIKQVRKIK